MCYSSTFYFKLERDKKTNFDFFAHQNLARIPLPLGMGRNGLLHAWRCGEDKWRAISQLVLGYLPHSLASPFWILITISDQGLEGKKEWHHK
jgi:hypothetical protein